MKALHTASARQNPTEEQWKALEASIKDAVVRAIQDVFAEGEDSEAPDAGSEKTNQRASRANEFKLPKSDTPGPNPMKKNGFLLPKGSDQ